MNQNNDITNSQGDQEIDTLWYGFEKLDEKFFQFILKDVVEICGSNFKNGDFEPSLLLLKKPIEKRKLEALEQFHQEYIRRSKVNDFYW